jgi:chaperonin GroES
MFSPIHAFVTVVLDPTNKKTPGGLVLPDGFGDTFVTGVVRAVGPGRWDGGKQITPDVRTGDRVMLAQHVTQVQQGRGATNRTIPYPVILDDGVACSLCDITDIVGIIRD